MIFNGQNITRAGLVNTRNVVRFLLEFRKVQIGSGAQPVLFSVDIVSFVCRGGSLKWLDDEADHSPPSSVKINVRSLVFLHGVGLVRHRDKFTFYGTFRSLHGCHVYIVYFNKLQILVVWYFYVYVGFMKKKIRGTMHTEGRTQEHNESVGLFLGYLGYKL